MANLVVGVDLGGTKIQTAALRSRKVVGQDRVETPQTGVADVVTAIAIAVRGALRSAGAQTGDLTAVGVGTPGEIGDGGTVTRSPNVQGFTDDVVPLARLVSRRLRGVHVAIDNDVRVAMLGEVKRGAARGHRNSLGVFVGTGVGGGLVIDGRIRRGGGALGEIGHTIVHPRGRKCSCGHRGHLEAYAGRGRIEWHARRLVDKGEKTELFHIMRKRGKDRLTSSVIAHALDRGDEMTVQLIDEAIEALGIGLASAQILLDLEAIVIGGGLGDRLGEPFLERIREQMRPRLFAPDDEPQLVPTALGDLGGAVGAAVLAGG